VAPPAAVAENMKKKTTKDGRSKQARGGKETSVRAAEKASNLTPSLLPRNRLLYT